ncbi:ABC transporter ATP-binding protein [Pseudogracilibacillus sp. SO10305]|uniref:ABC transporter ATP-binding protein n=1 Tax=Pseudogracilibacillus sp. SO10305 TaxID=3098292 RepID=UPI00300E4D51
MLKIDNITKRFGEHIAVDNLSLQIPEKELFGFLGGNGAGKTTTFRMILSLLNPTEGRILWNDEKISYNKSHLIGYLPEERGLYPKLKVKEQLIYLAKLRGMPADESLQSLERWLERFEISHYVDKKVEELSKGNQQKIQFISAVLHEPKLLILDEPFSGLDPINVEMLKKAVIDLKNKGTSIVFSSHRMDHVEELCEHICILREGKAVVQGNLQEIKQSFGKKNIIIHSEDELQFLQEVEGVLDFKATMQGCVLQIEEERIARNVFQALQGEVFVRKFEIEEPTLNDIFIAKVGEKYE